MRFRVLLTSILAAHLFLACANASDDSSDSGYDDGHAEGGAGGADASANDAAGEAGSDAGVAGAGGACIPFLGPCRGNLLCCDGTECLYEGCGIDPACVQPGQPCDGVGLNCCDGNCADGICTSP